jgi:MoaA/NifB/PqqE/SkfB family radical SAM enzyme
MERVDIKVGFYCNNQCKFCVQGRKRDTLPAKSTEEVKRSLQEAYNKGKREVVLTGGEPTLHPDFFGLIKIAKSIGFEEIQIQCNGRVFAYPDFCVKAIKAGATQFGPSLHGHNAKIHDFLTEAEGSFEQTTRGIKNLRALNQFVLTNSVITSSNYQHIPEMAQMLVDLDVAQFQFAFIHILGTANKNRDWIVPRKSDIMPFVKKGIDIAVSSGKGVMVEAVPYCLMDGYEGYVAEEVIPETSIYDAGFVVDSFTEFRRNNGKVKRPECVSCKFNHKCEGPWKEYAEIYGWDEFVPVKE